MSRPPTLAQATSLKSFTGRPDGNHRAAVRGAPAAIHIRPTDYRRGPSDAKGKAAGGGRVVVSEL